MQKGLEKSAFQLRVERLLSTRYCCNCGGTGHYSDTCPWSKEDA